jgi:arylsulfate sulfotransferase
MLLFIGCTALLACRPEAPSTGGVPGPTSDSAAPGEDVQLVAGPTLHRAALADIAPLVHGLTVQTEAPTRLTVHLDDGDRVLHVAFPEWSTLHEVPLLGVPASRTISVTAELTPEQGLPLQVDAGTYRTPGLPDPFPDIDILALDPLRMEPGYTFGALKSPAPWVHYLVAFDDRMELVWWSDDGGDYGDVRVRAEDAVIIGIRGDKPVHLSFLGEELLRYTSTPTAPTHVDYELGDAHHELYPLPDGSFWTLCAGATEVPAYPLNKSDPYTLTGPTVIDDQCAAHVAADGRTLQQVWMSDVLNTERIGFGSLTVTSRGRDWAHLNAVVPTEDGGILINSRHQDALIKLDADLKLQWLLADPAGWGPAFAPYLLTPVLTPEEGFMWPYHAHAPALDDDGTIWLFDNHAYGRTPYTPEEDASPEVTRIVQFRVDPDAMTVTQLFASTETSTGPLFVPALGDADPLPQTGHVLATYAFLDGEIPISNEEAGYGYKTVRVIEIDPARPSEPPMDVRLSSQRDEFFSGFQLYRSERIGSLYPADVVVSHTP